ncbi:RidA family protein [Haloarcula nitratireducens]|uniref:Rid family detoxifying hydrolase n=1 Tax=Haloarcula nitratireducens TaxID=2487749 RepID=A0AAW4PHU2_9EURY|nr:Rid family detoxifying hydrolase [Halomicroarcula nitratireducens]MBX0297086.1 Rid family detoxifying hydrolase [Halomicroarcula nitratireducens]
MEHIQTDAAPSFDGLPIGQATKHGDSIYLAQSPRDPETEELVSRDPAEQAEQVFQNIQAILSAADSNCEDIVKATVYLTDLDDADAVNQVYREYVGEPFPARCAVQVDDLAGDMKVEIDIVAAA